MHRPVGKGWEGAGPTATESGPTEWKARRWKGGQEKEGGEGKRARPDGKGGERSGPTEQETGPAEVEMKNETMIRRRWNNDLPKLDQMQLCLGLSRQEERSCLWLEAWLQPSKYRMQPGLGS